jgi:deoxyribodipyrimidine photo-lyase
VDSSCIVPSGLIESQSYAAYSLRPKVNKLLPRFLKAAEPIRVKRAYREGIPAMHTEAPPERIRELAASCEIDHGVRPSTAFQGGRGEAERRLDAFLTERLRRYAREKNEPAAHATSDLSPYLQAGYISSLEIALAVREHARKHKLIADEFLEELIVRRELAFNFARYASRLDSVEALPKWARETLSEHKKDPREAGYPREQFESAATADDLWNAAQKELLLRGKIHGYYRMYWGKKILEWSATPEEALSTMIHLNDRYALDGQGPNGYANILWCLGLHDRPWPERPVYGTVRSMSRAGMERKTDVKAYLREIESLERTRKEAAA